MRQVWTFFVKGELFVVGTLDERNLAVGPEYVDWTIHSTFIVDTPVRIAPPKLDAAVTKVTTGTILDITYTLQNAPPSFFIEARSGKVYGTLPQVGHYSYELVARDRGGEKQVLETVNLTAVADIQFVLKVESFRTRSGSSFTDPRTTDPFHVGRPYQFAPLEINRAESTVSLGSTRSITFTLDHRAPETMFIQAATGVIYGRFDAAGNYTFSLLAVDKGGQTAEVENLIFNAVIPPKFETASWWAPVAANVTRTIGEVYTIPGPNISKTELFKNANGGAEAVSYKLDFGSSGNPGSMLVDTDTGTILASPERVGQYEVWLIGTDASGAEVQVDVLDFEVILKPEFTTVASWNPFQRVDNMLSQYELDENFDVPAPALTRSKLFVDPAGGNPSRVNYVITVRSAMSGALLECPGPVCPGLFFVAQSGEMLLKFSHSGRYNMTLFGSDPSGALTMVRQWSCTVAPRDTTIDRFGPNGRGCGAGIKVDTVKFDGLFTCDCSQTKFIGDNCDVEPPAPTAAAGAEANTDDSPESWVIAVGLLSLFSVIAALGILTYRRHIHALKMQAVDFLREAEKMREAGDLGIRTDKLPREVKRSDVTLTEKIGAGAFGEVWKGILDESSRGGVPGYMVAIKTTKDAEGEGANEMVREATLMAQVDHHVNLVSLIGVVTSGVPMMLLLVYCEKGSLLSFLKRCKKEGLIVSLGKKLAMATDIASGMEHIALSKFIHRDLAARNVLVDTLETCKIADFGLSRGATVSDENKTGEQEEYYRSHGGAFPVRWTAPEAMETMIFTYASDVWSFGVVLVEVFKDGERPYPELDNAAVIHKIAGGYREPKPLGCPQVVFEVMTRCWDQDPEKRPPFSELAIILQNLVDMFLGALAQAPNQSTDSGRRASINAISKLQIYQSTLVRAHAGQGFGFEVETESIQFGQHRIVNIMPGSPADDQLVENDALIFIGGVDVRGLGQEDVSKIMAKTAAESLELEIQVIREQSNRFHGLVSPVYQYSDSMGTIPFSSTTSLPNEAQIGSKSGYFMNQLYDFEDVEEEYRKVVLRNRDNGTRRRESMDEYQRMSDVQAKFIDEEEDAYLSLKKDDAVKARFKLVLKTMAGHFVLYNELFESWMSDPTQRDALAALDAVHADVQKAIKARFSKQPLQPNSFVPHESPYSKHYLFKVCLSASCIPYSHKRLRH